MDSRDPADMNRTHPLQTVFRQAIQTFLLRSDGVNNNFTSSFMKLKENLDKIRADDVGFDDIFENERYWMNEDKAPCTYIEIIENEIINMSIFVLKPGFKMPLHDHPQMHGLLKVISGTVGIRTFSEIQPGTTNTDIGNFPGERDELDKVRSTSNGSPIRTLIAQVTDQKICDAESEACILTPEISNFHEIEALGGPSAFLDILAPPYSVYMNNFEPRECRYYRQVREISKDKVQLEEMPSPKWFFCDAAPYLGPNLS